MIPIAWFTAKERLSGLLRLVTLFAVLSLSSLGYLHSPSGDGPDITTFIGYTAGILLGFALSFGLVSQDLFHGSIHLLLARPLTRSQYLAGRLLGGFAVGFLTLALTYVLVVFWAWLAGVALPWTEAGEGLFFGTLSLIWTLVLFSAGGVFSAAQRRTDVLVFFLLLIPLWMRAILSPLSAPMLKELTEWWLRNAINVVVPPAEFFQEFPVRQLFRWASNVTLVLALSFWYFNRRELRYGKD